MDKLESLECRSIGYAGARNREIVAMDKLESLEELFAGRHFDREVNGPRQSVSSRSR